MGESMNLRLVLLDSAGREVEVRNLSADELWEVEILAEMLAESLTDRKIELDEDLEELSV